MARAPASSSASTPPTGIGPRGPAPRSRSPAAAGAPADALAGRDVVVHLAGAPVAQRWNAQAKQDILDSREIGTQRLVDGPPGPEPRAARAVCRGGRAFSTPGGR